jgi:dipeptidyl aminopeptidase/acylaminoacyl peptidase
MRGEPEGSPLGPLSSSPGGEGRGEREALLKPYRDRSPIHHVDGLNCPVIFFQGLEDQIVPPNQAEAMVAALEAKGVPTTYVPFEGEQHGFRKAENIKRSLEEELLFYGKTFKFDAQP